MPEADKHGPEDLANQIKRVQLAKIALRQAKYKYDSEETKLQEMLELDDSN